MEACTFEEAVALWYDIAKEITDDCYHGAFGNDYIRGFQCNESSCVITLYCTVCTQWQEGNV